MISRSDFKNINLVLNKLGHKEFSNELNNGQYEVLKENDTLVEFIKQFAIEHDKEKALQLAEYIFNKSEEKNKKRNKLSLLRIQSVYYTLLQDIEKCRQVLKEIEAIQPKVSKLVISEARLNLAMAARMKGEFGLAFEMYYKNISFWAKDETQYAINSLTRTYTNLSVLYDNIDNKEKASYYFEKVERLLPKINIQNLYTQCLILSTYYKFKNKIITAQEAISTMQTIEDSLLVGNFPYKVYMIQYLFSNNNIDQTLKLSYELIKDEDKIPKSILAEAVNYYLKCLYQTGKEDEFLEYFDKYYTLLSTTESLLNNFLDLFDKKIEIYERTKNFKGLVDLYRNYSDQQKRIFKKYKRIEQNTSKAKLNIREKELELEHLKELFKSNEKNNKLLLEKNKSLENFAAMTAHDLKAPLGNIAIFIGMLKNRLDLETDDKEMFNFISSSSKRLRSMIDDLLSFANSGTFANTENNEIQLSSIVNNVKANLKNIIAEKKATIYISENLPIIKINSSAITVLIQNIINNSLKFTRTDIFPIIKINIEITTDFINLAIKDNGIGIAEEDLSKIFSPFAKSLRTKNIEGNGLGLATCIKIVKSYNGSIIVKSKIDEGSTFTICLPKSLLVK